MQFAATLDMNHDFNGDGLVDFAIAASAHSDADSAQEGWVFVYHTTAAGAVGPPVTYENPLDEAGGVFGFYIRH